jgi:hypothetical protein
MFARQEAEAFASALQGQPPPEDRVVVGLALMATNRLQLRSTVHLDVDTLRRDE